MKDIMSVNVVGIQQRNLPGFSFCRTWIINKKSKFVCGAVFFLSSSSSTVCVWERAAKMTTVCGFELFYRNVSSFPLSYQGKKNIARIENQEFFFPVDLYTARRTSSACVNLSVACAGVSTSLCVWRWICFSVLLIRTLFIARSGVHSMTNGALSTMYHRENDTYTFVIIFIIFIHIGSGNRNEKRTTQ